MAASVVFAMLYVGAIEGRDQWIAPKHVIRMTGEQAAVANDAARTAYAKGVMRPGFRAPGARWYEENSREPIRDETIRGLIGNNSVLERSGVATTSSHPRYALRSSFAALFDPNKQGDALATEIEAWQRANLSAAALARVTLLRRGAVTTGHGELVTFPNGETRRLAPGPSSVISKAVIEQFTRRFLTQPAVLWLSESGAKVVARDDELARSLNLTITPDKALPDIILVDLGDGDAASFLLVFVEVVATDGPITPARQKTMLDLATAAKFSRKRVAFVTAFLDRARPAFKRSVPELAWRSFAWLAAEPEHIIILHDGAESSIPLQRLMRN